MATDSPWLEASLQVAPGRSPGLDVGEIGSDVRTRPEELSPSRRLNEVAPAWTRTLIRALRDH